MENNFMTQITILIQSFNFLFILHFFLMVTGEARPHLPYWYIIESLPTLLLKKQIYVNNEAVFVLF